MICCNKCGASNSSRNSFCTTCGASLRPAGQPAPIPSYTLPPRPPLPVLPAASTKPKWLWAVVGALVAVICIAAPLLWFRLARPPAQSPAPPPESRPAQSAPDPQDSATQQPAVTQVGDGLREAEVLQNYNSYLEKNYAKQYNAMYLPPESRQERISKEGYHYADYVGRHSGKYVSFSMIYPDSDSMDQLSALNGVSLFVSDTSGKDDTFIMLAHAAIHACDSQVDERVFLSQILDGASHSYNGFSYRVSKSGNTNAILILKIPEKESPSQQAG